MIEGTCLRPRNSGDGAVGMTPRSDLDFPAPDWTAGSVIVYRIERDIWMARAS